MEINSYNKFCSYQYVSRETYEKFEIFHMTLLKWQSSINLISRSSTIDIWTRHILDSAQLYDFTKEINGNILDMGSGAGFPGIILAMMGNKKINVVESDQKKCVFMGNGSTTYELLQYSISFSYNFVLFLSISNLFVQFLDILIIIMIRMLVIL